MYEATAWFGTGELAAAGVRNGVTHCGLCEPDSESQSLNMQAAGIRADNGPGPWPRAHPHVEGIPEPLEGPALRCSSSASSQANETEPSGERPQALSPLPGF
jgi:hypothetical protein